LLATLSVPKGVTGKLATTSVIVNGTTVNQALIDTGAAVTVVNKVLVDSLGLTAELVNSEQAIIAANNELIPVAGFVEMTIVLAHTPIKLYALYVPKISLEQMCFVLLRCQSSVKVRPFGPQKLHMIPRLVTAVVSLPLGHRTG